MTRLYRKIPNLLIIAVLLLLSNGVYANYGDSAQVHKVSFGNNQVRKLFKTIYNENKNHPNQFEDFIAYSFNQDDNEYITVFFNDQWLLPFVKQEIESNLGCFTTIHGYMRYKKHNCVVYGTSHFFRIREKSVKLPDKIYRMDINAEEYISKMFSNRSDTVSINVDYRGCTYKYVNKRLIPCNNDYFDQNLILQSRQ